MTRKGRGKALAVVAGVGVLVVCVVVMVAVDWDAVTGRHDPRRLVGTWEQISVGRPLGAADPIDVHPLLWSEQFTVDPSHGIRYTVRPSFQGAARFSVEGSTLTLHDGLTFGGDSELSFGFGLFGTDRLWLQGDGTLRHHFRRHR